MKLLNFKLNYHLFLRLALKRHLPKNKLGKSICSLLGKAKFENVEDQHVQWFTMAEKRT